MHTIIIVTYPTYGKNLREDNKTDLGIGRFDAYPLTLPTI